MSQSNKASFINYSWRTFLTQVAATLLGAMIVIATARVLGPAGKGTLTLLVMIPVLAVAFLHLGIGQAAVFHAPRAPRSALVATSMALIGSLGLLAVFLALPLVLGLRHSLFRGIPAGWLAFMCALIPITLFYDLFAALYQALYRINVRNLMVLACPAFNLLLFLFLAGARGMGVKGGMIAWALAYALTVAIGAAWMAAIVPPSQLHGDRALGRSLLGFGVRTYWGSLLNMLNTRFDFLLIGFFLTAADLGLFTVAIYLAELLWKLPESVAIVLQPRVAQLPEAEARRFTPRVLRLLLPPLLLGALLIAAFSAPLIRVLFGSPFAGAGPALLILLPGFLANAVVKVLASDMLARGHPLKYSAVSALAFFAMLLFDLWLIPGFGIRGAAWASTIAYFLAALAMVVFYLRATGIPLRTLLFPGPGDPGVMADARMVARLLLPVPRREPPPQR